MTREDYEISARQWFTSVRDGLRDEQALVEILGAADGTLAEWRESYPLIAAEADRLAAEIGFDIPNTDDYVWQAREALDDFLRETGGYGADVFSTVRVTLAGGGPAGWIDFRLDRDGELVSATVVYCDWFQAPIEFELDDSDAEFAYSRYYVELIAAR
jgi:hypothetical protein